MKVRILHRFFRAMSLEEAVIEIKTKRDVKPNAGFLQQLIDYEYRLLESREVETS